MSDSACKAAEINNQESFINQQLESKKKNPFDWLPVIETKIAVDYRGTYAGNLVNEEMIDTLPDYPRNTPTKKM